jgi:hypothetical protein
LSAPAQPELDHGPPARRGHATRGFAREHRLEVADVQHGALDQLGFGEEGRALGCGAHAAGEAEVAEVLDEGGLELLE